MKAPRLFYSMIQARADLAVPYRGKGERPVAKTNKIILDHLSPCFEEVGRMLGQVRWTRANTGKGSPQWHILYALGPQLPRGGKLLLQIDAALTLFLILEYSRPKPATLYLPIARHHTAEVLARLIAASPEDVAFIPSPMPAAVPTERDCMQVLRSIPGWRKLTAGQMVAHIRYTYPTHPLILAQATIKKLFEQKLKRLRAANPVVAPPSDLSHNEVA
jgi:hypothetical protein